MRTPNTKVMCVKLTQGEEKAINALVASGKFISKGDVLRHALLELLDKYIWLWGIREEIRSERRVQRPRHGKAVRTPMDATP